MSELLPCPFCGGEANVIDHHNDDGSVSVGCNNDTCLGFSGLGWLYKTEAEAIAAWNTRAAYEIDDYFYLPKPKEPIAETIYTDIERTENGYKVDAFTQLIEDNAKKWAKEMDSFLINRLCEVFRPERTCENVADWRDDKGVFHRDARLFKCSLCGFKADDFYGDDEQNFPNYCPNCGARRVGE